MKYALQKGGLRESVLKAWVLSVIFSGFTFLCLRQWVVLTISVGPVDKIYQMIDAAAVLAFIVVFTSSFMASYFSIEKEV